MNIKIENYGDLLEKAFKKKCLAYVLFGSYQGEWVAVLDGGDRVELWKGSYGSCSGCDYLEGCDYEMTQEEIDSYFKEDKPFIEISKDIISKMSFNDLESILPANIRDDIYGFDAKEMYESLKKAVS